MGREPEFSLSDQTEEQSYTVIRTVKTYNYIFTPQEQWLLNRLILTVHLGESF